MINMKLAREKGLDQETITVIELTQNYLKALISNPHVFDMTPIEVVHKVEDLEIKLQKLWGFQINVLFHSYWFNMRWCRCPILDNRDDLGYRQHINMDCPFHGSNIANDWNDERFDNEY